MVIRLECANMTEDVLDLVEERTALINLENGVGSRGCRYSSLTSVESGVVVFRTGIWFSGEVVL